MPVEQIAILTKDGRCPTQVLRPSGQGPWPAIIFYMDAGGIRPAMTDMAQRLADNGYLVLVPDLFYRFGPYGPLVPKEVFAGDARAILGPLIASTDNLKAAEDSQSIFDYLAQSKEVSGESYGAVGFCMGGGMALSAAGISPEKISAICTFHGGRLATDAPTSPHLSAANIKAEVYIAAAKDDGSYPAEMAERLKKVLADAGVKFREEVFAAAHGWMIPDFPVYDHAAAERGWAEMLAVFERNLKN